MASIQSLPVELLTRIFYLGTIDPLLDINSSSAAPIPADPPFEVLASHVCAHWRAVALRTPSLWTNLSISQVSHIPRARTYLTRSSFPIRILVDSASESDAIPGHSIFRDEFLDAFDPLTPHIARWAAFTLRVRDLTCKSHARTVLSTCGPAPLLESLELWHIEEWGTSERLFTAIGPPPVVVFSGQLPSLTRLSLIGVNIQWHESASPFLRGLTELELGVHSDDVRIPFDRWRAVLLASPQLTRLSLTYSGPRARAGPWRLRNAGRVPLPALRELRLVDLDAPYVCALLRTIDAPGVTRLYLELGIDESPQDYTALLDMLAYAPPEPGEGPGEEEEEPDAVEPMRAYVSVWREGAPPMFPALKELAVAALREVEQVSWKRLLQRVPGLRALEIDLRYMCPSAFDVLLLPASGDLQSHFGSGKGCEEKNGGKEKDADVLLPALHTLRISGASGAALSSFARVRRQAGRPIRRWYVNEAGRDAEMERLMEEINARGRAEPEGEHEEEERESMEWFGEEGEEEYEDGEEGEEPEEPEEPEESASDETAGEEEENGNGEGGVQG